MSAFIGLFRRGSRRGPGRTAARRAWKRGGLAWGGLKSLAPEIECLLHRAVRETEQHRLFVGFEPVRQPGRADEYVLGSKDQRLVSETATAFAFDDCIDRGVGRAIVLAPESLREELHEGADGRHRPIARHRIRILQLVAPTGVRAVSLPQRLERFTRALVRIPEKRRGAAL